MIIDGQADFRHLLMHHVTTHWPDAVIFEYDPTASGHLPNEFTGAGNDIVLLGDEQGERDRAACDEMDGAVGEAFAEKPVDQRAQTGKEGDQPEIVTRTSARR